MAKKQHGFTLVELLVVIVVIGILAAITLVSYNGTQQRASVAAMTTDLKNAADAFELAKVGVESYPTTMPSDYKPSAGNVLQATNTGNSTSYCINAYSTTKPTLRMYWDSINRSAQNGLCNGATIGSASGGGVPVALRGVNLMSDFSHWTLASGAAYNSTTGELTLGATGTARSALIRVDQPVGMKAGGDFYATIASPYSGWTAKGGFHIGTQYYGSDGSTPAQNSAGSAANGCAQPITLSSWSTNNQACVFFGGPNVIYTVMTLYATNSGYASSDLKIKNPLLITNN